MLDMASDHPSTEQIDALSDIVFDDMSGVKMLINFIPVINCPTSAFEPSVNYPTSAKTSLLYESSFVEVGQLIACILIASFLTPDIASRNNVRHGIGLS